jgi:signal transduction histidine kinase
MDELPYGVSSAADTTRSVLDFIHGLLRASPPAQDVPALLRALAQAFGATSAGMAALADHGSADQQFPWRGQPDLLRRIRQAPTAVPLVAPGAGWLVASIQPAAGGWLLWLEANEGRAWSASEAAALSLAGEALARLGAAPTPPSGALGHAAEQAQLQEHLEQAAQLTGKLAHDFGNVLTGILGFTELSLTHLPPDSLPHRYVNEAWQAAQAGARWVEKLRLFSRRQSRPSALGSMAAAVASEEARARPDWGADVALHVALAPDLPDVALDLDSLKYVLARLLDNAREAITGQGVVTLSARVTELSAADCQELLGSARPGPSVELTVTDTGPGLSDETRRRLFREPFFSTKVRHRGLGLATVYGILRAHGGGLRFGPHPERGTAVRLFLPVPATPAPGPGGRDGGERILVVDDDPLVLRYVSMALERAGYRTHAAAGGAEALAAYTQPGASFRLVVTDVLMPQMNGFELARRLRQRDPEVNLLFISSEPSPAGWPPQGIDRFEFLPKPFRPEALLQAVRAACARGGLLPL